MKTARQTPSRLMLKDLMTKVTNLCPDLDQNLDLGPGLNLILLKNLDHLTLEALHHLPPQGQGPSQDLTLARSLGHHLKKAITRKIPNPGPGNRGVKLVMEKVNISFISTI